MNDMEKLEGLPSSDDVRKGTASKEKELPGNRNVDIELLDAIQ